MTPGDCARCWRVSAGPTACSSRCWSRNAADASVGRRRPHEERLEVLHPQRSAVQIALRLLALQLSEQGQLLLALDAFGHGVEIERARQRDNGGHHGLRGLVAGEPADEGP